MLLGSTVTIVFILYYRLLYWIDQVVTSSILLNIQIMTEGAALNVQDTMQLNLNDINIAKAYKELSLKSNFSFNPYFNNQTVVHAYQTLPGVQYSSDQVNFFVPERTNNETYSLQ